jgi:hypothetical protein
MPLELSAGHLFLHDGDRRYLLDTGAPQSFGDEAGLTLDGQSFALQPEFMGLSAGVLSDLVQQRADGLLGADVLNQLDLRLDVAGGVVELSRAPMDGVGEGLPLRFAMGVPIVRASMGGEEASMFFDTGAQLSYWQASELRRFEPAGQMSDFYPGFGTFETDTFRVPVRLGGRMHSVRCGQLPAMLGMSLMVVGSSGIIGNEVLQNHVAYYLARRSLLVLP